MSKWECPFCGKRNTSEKCELCGFDHSMDYGRLPVLIRLRRKELDEYYARCRKASEIACEKNQPPGKGKDDDEAAVPPDQGRVPPETVEGGTAENGKDGPGNGRGNNPGLEHPPGGKRRLSRGWLAVAAFAFVLLGFCLGMSMVRGWKSVPDHESYSGNGPQSEAWEKTTEKHKEEASENAADGGNTEDPGNTKETGVSQTSSEASDQFEKENASGSADMAGIAASAEGKPEGRIDLKDYAGEDFMLLLQKTDEIGANIHVDSWRDDEVKIGGDSNVSITALPDNRTIVRARLQEGELTLCAEGVYPGQDAGETESMLSQNGYRLAGYRQDDSDSAQEWIITLNEESGRFLAYKAAGGTVTAVYYGIDGYLPFRNYVQADTAQEEAAKASSAGTTDQADRSDLAEYVGRDYHALLNGTGGLAVLSQSDDETKIGNDNVSVTADSGGTIVRLRLHKGDTAYCAEGVYSGLTYEQMEQAVLGNGFVKDTSKDAQDAENETWVIYSHPGKERFLACRVDAGAVVTAVYYGLSGYMPL